MEAIRELQLSLWRESCRHIDIGESIPELMRVIRTAVPAEAMWIFSCEAGRIVLVAGPNHSGSIPRTVAEAEEAARIMRYARRGALSVLSASQPGKSLLRALAPSFGPGRVVCGGLGRHGTADGIVAWRLPRGTELTDRLCELLAATLEPLAVALDTSRRFHELESLRRSAEADRQSALRRLGRETLTEPIVGASLGLRPVMERVEAVASQDVPVLILGETGAGKEVIARAIHERSDRHDGPFLRVNCGAIPPELVDSQLFGHERGAFTGATEQRLGWFERADGGTLFLDEIGELPPAAQVRLLRVVQEGTLERVGGQSTVTVDCRIVAATHRDLAEMVRSRAFREDLWYRISVFPIVLPALRERPEDLPALVEHFTHRAAVRFGLPEFEVTAPDIEMLQSYAWPGNVRELAAVIDRAALLGAGHRLALRTSLGTGESLRHAPMPHPMNASAQPDPIPLNETVKRAIEAALRASGGRVEGPSGAAVRLGLNPNTLRSKMRKLGIRATRGP